MVGPGRDHCAVPVPTILDINRCVEKVKIMNDILNYEVPSCFDNPIYSIIIKDYPPRSIGHYPPVNPEPKCKEVKHTKKTKKQKRKNKAARKARKRK